MAAGLVAAGGAFLGGKVGEAIMGKGDKGGGGVSIPMVQPEQLDVNKTVQQYLQNTDYLKPILQNAGQQMEASLKAADDNAAVYTDAAKNAIKKMRSLSGMSPTFENEKLASQKLNSIYTDLAKNRNTYNKMRKQSPLAASGLSLTDTAKLVAMIAENNAQVGRDPRAQPVEMSVDTLRRMVNGDKNLLFIDSYGNPRNFRGGVMPEPKWYETSYDPHDGDANQFYPEQVVGKIVSDPVYAAKQYEELANIQQWLPKAKELYTAVDEMYDSPEYAGLTSATYDDPRTPVFKDWTLAELGYTPNEIALAQRSLYGQEIAEYLPYAEEVNGTGLAPGKPVPAVPAAHDYSGDQLKTEMDKLRARYAGGKPISEATYQGLVTGAIASPTYFVRSALPGLQDTPRELAPFDDSMWQPSGGQVNANLQKKVSGKFAPADLTGGAGAAARPLMAIQEELQAAKAIKDPGRQNAALYAVKNKLGDMISRGQAGVDQATAVEMLGALNSANGLSNIDAKIEQMNGVAERIKLKLSGGVPLAGMDSLKPLRDLQKKFDSLQGLADNDERAKVLADIKNEFNEYTAGIQYDIDNYRNESMGLGSLPHPQVGSRYMGITGLKFKDTRNRVFDDRAVFNRNYLKDKMNRMSDADVIAQFGDGAGGTLSGYSKPFDAWGGVGSGTYAAHLRKVYSSDPATFDLQDKSLYQGMFKADRPGYLSGNVEAAQAYDAQPAKYDKSLSRVAEEQDVNDRLADFSADLNKLTTGMYDVLDSVPQNIEEPMTPDDLQSYLTSQPGFEAAFKQGAQELQRGLAAKGLLGSGQGLLYAQQYSQDAIQKAYQQEIDRLSQVANIGLPFAQQKTAGETLRAEAVRQAGVAPTLVQEETNRNIGTRLLDSQQFNASNKQTAASGNQDALTSVRLANGTY